ncbi:MULTISPECIES: hypothetical protein [unclassified Thermococcus]|nr:MULTISPECIES: hypothetical protein [unclassified Thermococcus]
MRAFFLELSEDEEEKAWEEIASEIERADEVRIPESFMGEMAVPQLR